MYPGSGDNLRVLNWTLGRYENKVDAKKRERFTKFRCSVELVGVLRFFFLNHVGSSLGLTSELVKII